MKEEIALKLEKYLARSVLLARHLNEAVIQRQIVADRVLPALTVVAIVRKTIHDELIDAIECDAVIVGLLDGHDDQCDVRIGRLFSSNDGADRRLTQRIV